MGFTRRAQSTLQHDADSYIKLPGTGSSHVFMAHSTVQVSTRERNKTALVHSIERLAISN
jgi:hypothetical protein